MWYLAVLFLVLVVLGLAGAAWKSDVAREIILTLALVLAVPAVIFGVVWAVQFLSRNPAPWNTPDKPATVHQPIIGSPIYQETNQVERITR